MRTALLKAFLTTLAVIVFCELVCCAVLLWIGDEITPFPLIMTAVLPAITAFPNALYTYLQNHRLQAALQELKLAHQQLQAKSRVDHMTGLLNRGSFFDAMKISRSRIETGAALVIDADHFKSINDTYGHAIGDRALKIIAFALQNVTRKGDIVGRIGGEEFCIFLPGASRDTALRLAERVRSEVENTPFYTTANRTHPLTISIGCAMAPKHESNSQVLSKADKCLYQAKQRGRNCVVFDDSDLPAATVHLHARLAAPHESDLPR
ncbi:GGDEF domain-containing protein [Phyllobacterium salinisoli]|uniref:diguanylate cyclase n=1 Tax=Phyllobacterium salinisoli TaxID=1899321 RepID=A0A368K808_9HYPH|nr:GGDEF domain-containing protein [Phyllobacterium salinisoli]RCS24190.1 GGDEF domain-containing protein [Phyllobacterium salinisoli]